MSLDTALQVLHATEEVFTNVTGIEKGTKVGNLEPALVAWYVFTNGLMAWSTIKFCLPFGSTSLTVGRVCCEGFELVQASFRSSQVLVLYRSSLP